jgi:hypothetical protein
MLVFTLGDERTSPFRFNPFEVPLGIPVESHISRLGMVQKTAKLDLHFWSQTEESKALGWQGDAGEFGGSVTSPLAAGKAMSVMQEAE